MSEKKMWFGNRAYMQWVPCPTAGGDYGANPASTSMDYMNGGSFRKQTLSASKRFALTWSLTSRQNIRAITDYAEGVYGDYPIYWADPFTMDANMLSQSFATPSLGGYDGVILNGTDVRPELIPTSANSLGYPYESAIYTMSSADAALRHWIPIPPGYTAWVGVHGASGSGGAVYARATTGLLTANAAQALTILPVDTTTRVTDSFGGTGVTGVEIWLGGAGTITLSGIIVQVLPTGRTPALGGFISGQGHSGCTWDGMPAKNAYSAAMDLVGLTANFVETEQWR